MQPVTRSQSDWQAGYFAAMTDDAPAYPPDCQDRLAFWAGFIEGRAACKRAGIASGNQLNDH